MTDSRSNAPGGVRPGRIRADFDDNTVVFMIGMRFNAIWRVTHWLPVFLAMPKMLTELGGNRELGLLGASSWIRWREVMVVQYWRDMDHLMRYAIGKDNEHLPAWSAFNRRARSASSVGIWHEAYEVHPRASHIIYRDMPLGGMGKAAGLREVATMPPQAVKRKGAGPDDADVAGIGQAEGISSRMSVSFVVGEFRHPRLLQRFSVVLA